MKNKPSSQKTERTKPQFFIDSYTLSQFAAFCLASNWALKQHTVLVKSQHFFNFFEKRFADEKVFSFLSAEEPIKNIRNFFSHTVANPVPQLEKTHIETLKRILRNCLLELLHVRKTDLEDESGKILRACRNDDKLEKLFNFEDSPLGQPETAFLLSPFLTRSQVSFLIGKIYFGAGSRQPDEDGNMQDTPLTCAKKQILKTLSHSDNIVLRSSEGGNDPWLSPKHEQGFAIWGLLEKCYEKDSGEDGSPVDLDDYFMKQLLLFVENNNVLPGLLFARTKTEIDEKGAINQIISFEAEDAACPFAIRYNTIRIRLKGRETEGTIGLQALKYIVAVYLLKGENCGELSEWMKGWYLENEGYPQRRVIRSGSSESLKKRVSSRLKYLKELNEKEPENLQEQIRFICRFINLAHKNKYEKHFHREDYKNLQEKVRFYRKEVLRGYLQDLKVLDVGGIQLGRGDEKMLRHLIKDETIQDLYRTLSKNYGDWIIGCEERLHKLSDDELERLAGKIQLRKKVEKPNNPPSIGIDSSAIRNEFFPTEDRLSFFKLTKRLHTRPKLPGESPEDGRKYKKEREIWARRQLLFAMAKKSVKDLSDIPMRFSKDHGQKEFPKLSQIPVSIETGNHHIKLKLSKSWRNMAHYPKKIFENLIKVYLDGHKPVPLFRADESEDGVSIESALREMQKERFFLIQSLLKWEKNFVAKNCLQRNNSGYVEFKKIAQKAGLDDAVIPLRDKAFHNEIHDHKRFSSVPSPIKEEYKQLSKQAEERRKRQKKRQIKPNRKV